MSATATPPRDLESREWLHDLRAGGATADAAAERLHVLLRRAASFEVARRRRAMSSLEDGERIVLEAADEALVSILRQLDDFRGDSRFTTWASKFAVLEVAVNLQRETWRGRDLPPDSRGLDLLSSLALEPEIPREQRELLVGLRTAISRLTRHERRVLVALALNGVPIDVLADRMHTTRGALYETLHDARSKLRRDVAVSGLAVE
jgi:RNA polymerase sigma-70 factor (ECF subfamily)